MKYSSCQIWKQMCFPLQWECTWFIILCSSFLLLLFWAYFWLVAQNDFNEFNWWVSKCECNIFFLTKNWTGEVVSRMLTLPQQGSVVGSRCYQAALSKQSEWTCFSCSHSRSVYNRSGQWRDETIPILASTTVGFSYITFLMVTVLFEKFLIAHFNTV